MNNLSIVSAFLEERLGTDPALVTPEAVLKNLGVDSLMLLELLFEFEERFNTNLSRNMPTPKTVGDLLAIVDRMQTGKTTD
ncbi:MAG TPA: phosphopantetheine-binding protein [Rhodocyclaceae bacterium]|nr:phosphopantetheine-binding protein [Rhodocyclaceae bacterium]